MNKRNHAPAGLVLLALAAGACSNGTGPGGNGTTVPVTLSIGTRSGASNAPGISATSEQITIGANTLVIDQVQMVLRQIELKRVSSDQCPSDEGTSAPPALSEGGSGGGTGNGGDDDGGHGSGGDDPSNNHRNCYDVETGPIVLDLPLGGGIERAFSVDVAAATYGEIEFEIHKPSGNNDREFVQAHPEFDGVSVRVTGTYNGAPFTYLGDITAKQELTLNPPLVVEEGVPANVTLIVDISQWFVSQGALIDPMTANLGGPNLGLVKQNIRASLGAFEDGNGDGRKGD